MCASVHVTRVCVCHDRSCLHPHACTPQFDGQDNADAIREAAWAHLKLSDTQYLPLEPMRLRHFLAKWGAFPHIQVGLA